MAMHCGCMPADPVRLTIRDGGADLQFQDQAVKIVEMTLFCCQRPDGYADDLRSLLVTTLPDFRIALRVLQVSTRVDPRRDPHNLEIQAPLLRVRHPRLQGKVRVP